MKKVLLILLTILLLTGCSQDYDDTEFHDGQSTTPPTTTPPKGELVVQPKQGGKVSLGVSEYNSLNPLTTDNEDMKYYMSLVYDSMYYLDHQLQEVNGLAIESNMENDGLTWIIKLREDATWHNGNIFNATDCIYTIDLIMRKGGIYEANVANIKDCTLIDEFTLCINLKKPDLYFVGKLTFPILPSFYNDIDSNPMGTGMYMFTSIEDNKLIFTRNEKYWDDKPYIDSIEIVKYENERLKYESESDMFILHGEFVNRYLNKGGYISTKYVGRGYTCLMPNLRSNSVLSDVNIRKALLYCLDNDNIIKSALSGYGVSSAWPAVPGTIYYQDGILAHTRDLDKAVEFLKKAGYFKDVDDRWYRVGDIDKRYPLTIPCNVMLGDIQMRKCAETIKKQVEETGIIFNIVYSIDTNYINVLANGQFTLAIVDINIGTWPEYEAIFSKGKMNLNGYSNKEVDNFIANLYTSENIAATMSEIKTILDEDLPLIGLYFSQEAVVMSQNLLGRTDDVFFWNPFNDFNKLHYFTEGIFIE